MDISIWLFCFLPLVIVLWLEYEYTRKEKQRRTLHLIKNNRKKGLKTMSEAIKNFIGKECIITTMNATVTGKIESIEDNWITIRALDKVENTEILNIDYISRIQEYPRNKSGKKKAIVG